MQGFKKIQQDFVQHIKNPDSNGFEYQVEERRLKIYRELFFNNIRGFIDSAFPVLKSLYSVPIWNSLVRIFFAKHSCRSPYFVDISKEFVEFLSNEYELKASDPIFLRELAHYEWIELDVSVRKSQQQAQPVSGESLPERIVMSELASLVSYPFAVHQISQSYQPTHSQDTVYIIVYRNLQDEVAFFVVNALTAHMLTIIDKRDGIKVSQLTDTIINDLPHLPAEQILLGMQGTIKQLLEKQVLLVPRD